MLLTLFLTGISTTPSFSQKYDATLASYLEEADYDGVILLYDYNEDQMYTSNRLKMNDRVLPASTFKIFNTLLFLELGIVKDTSQSLAWDGTEYKHKGRKINAWCKDSNLAQAFRNSTVWYYEKMSEPIEFSVYRDYLKLIEYGEVNSKKRGDLDFWNYGNKIGMSAMDQILLLTKLYENELPFKQAHMNTVKDLMVEKKTDAYTLRSKTGWTVRSWRFFCKSKDLGWYIGYVEYAENVYFFAVRLEKPKNRDDANFSRDRKKIAWKAMRHVFSINS